MYCAFVFGTADPPHVSPDEEAKVLITCLRGIDVLIGEISLFFRIVDSILFLELR